MMAYRGSEMLLASWIVSTCFLFLFLHKNAMGMTIEKSIIDSAPKAGMFDTFHLMPHGEVMIMTEFDLLFTIDQYKALYSSTSKSREKRKAVRDVSFRWTGCAVYYEITESLNTTDDRVVIKKAIQVWEKYSCLQFIENKSASRRIQFKDGDGCYSQLGMQKAPQPLVLAKGCRTVDIIVHEIGHAVGFYHEHMRPDRDDYIKINFNVIPEKFKPNFVKYDANVVSTYNVPYDYTSIMHYGSTALPGSIITLDPKYQDRIGQRKDIMSFKDIKLANLMYNCAENMGCEPKTCSHSGFVLYKNHKKAGACQCWCDSGNVDDPLTLCSNISEEAPGPNIQPIVPPVTKQCYDVREDCRDLKLKDNDVCVTNMKLMMASCAKTCQFCGKGENLCVDHDKGCPLLAASGSCTDEGLRPMVEHLCKESCGLCKPAMPCEVQNVMMEPSEIGGMKHLFSLNVDLRMMLLCANMKSGL